MSDRPDPRSWRARLTGPVAQFAWAGLVAVVVIGVVATLLVQQALRREAIRDAEHLTAVVGRGIVEPALTEALLDGRPSARERLDRVVSDEVIEREGVVRVKIWDERSRIVYSDEPRLIGESFALGEQELEILREGGVEAEATELSRPENRYERGLGDLLEVYLPISSPDGEPLLFEAYLSSGFVASNEDRTLATIAPLLIGAVVLLGVLLLPLAARLAHRLRRGQLEREALLSKAIDSSQLERRRIAQDLHDGVVQDIAGASFAVSAASRAADRPDADRRLLGGIAGQLRQSLRDLRGLLIEIYPPDLKRAGLQAALSDVVAGLDSRSVQAHISVPDDLELPDDVEALFFRTAQEAVRNAVAHAQASRIEVFAALEDGFARLEVRDDGSGFSHDAGAANGHFGLRTIADLVRDAGGEFEIDTAPGRGTTLRIEVPVP